jgi:hypothetical protein
VAAQAAAAEQVSGGGWAAAPRPSLRARAPPPTDSPRTYGPRLPLVWGFATGSCFFFFPPPLSRSLLLLLGCSTPPRIRGGGTSLAAAANWRRVRLRTPGAEPRVLPVRCRARSSRFLRTPRPPSPATLLYFSPLLQSHGILRMPERWR